ncbi:hypothetical protein Cgig2_018054 [Carnegiea gigantea]|uniref:MADS-box domain-containing protein n=1 Tax=Carnegiea gigantea TaxID=171969 RepID=A0A9Q1GWB8_9CARY|nr:hypothetical protein Cgig2_018054 [Carnegiea gigantea]
MGIMWAARNAFMAAQGRRPHDTLVFLVCWLAMLCLWGTAGRTGELAAPSPALYSAYRQAWVLASLTTKNLPRNTSSLGGGKRRISIHRSQTPKGFRATMTRSKVKLELIANESARKTTFRKRKKGLLKKMEELTTLCGVDACAILSSPFEPNPEVWPSPAGARKVLSRFMSLPEEVQSKRMLNQEAYLRERVRKTTELLEKLRKENHERELTNLMYDILNGDQSLEGLDMKDAMDLCMVIDKTMYAILRRIDYLKRMENSHGEGPSDGPGCSADASA